MTTSSPGCVPFSLSCQISALPLLSSAPLPTPLFPPPALTTELTATPSQRLDAIGRDAKKNEYYHTLDNRLWIKRAPPPGPRAPLRIKISLAPPPSKKPLASKAKPSTKPRSAPKGRGAPKERGTKRAVDEVEESPRKRGRRDREEVWEEIPEELLQEWEEPGEGKGKGKAREGSVASSGLTSLGEEEEDGDEEMEVDEPEPEVVEEEVDEEEEITQIEEDEYDGRMQWEKDYWAERARCDVKGFVEWEAVSSLPRSGQ